MTLILKGRLKNETETGLGRRKGPACHFPPMSQQQDYLASSVAWLTALLILSGICLSIEHVSFVDL